MRFDTKFIFWWLRESNVMMGFASYTRRDWCKLTDNNTQADRHIKRRRSIVLGLVPGGGGVLNFGLDRGVPLGILKCHPCMYQFWRKIDPSMYQKSKFSRKFCAILAQIPKDFEK